MSTLFIVFGCAYLLVCLSLIWVIILQKKRSAGLGSLSGAAGSYWDRNKGNSIDGKLEKFTKFGAFLYALMTIAICFIK